MPITFPSCLGAASDSRISTSFNDLFTFLRTPSSFITTTICDIDIISETITYTEPGGKTQLTKSNIELALKAIKKPYVYIFEILNYNTSVGGKIEKAYRNAIAKNGRTYQHLATKPHITKYLYIGQARTTALWKRMQQHLGDGNAKTGALHLKYWASGYKFRVHIFELNTPKGYEYFSEIVEKIFQNSLKPIVGKY